MSNAADAPIDDGVASEEIGTVEMRGSTLVGELLDDIELRIEPCDDGELLLRFVDTERMPESVLYAQEHKPDFYRKGQTIGEIKNRVVSEVAGEHASAAVATAFRNMCTVLADNHEDIQQAIRPPVMSSLLDQTESVEIYGGFSSTFVVRMSRANRERELMFTTGEIMGANPAPFRDKYGSAFYEKVSLEPDVWEELAEEWIDMAIEVDVETLTEEEATANEVTNLLSQRLMCVSDREAITNGTMTAWYDFENSRADNDVADVAGPDADVIWVTNDAVRETLTDVGKRREYMAQLSPALRKVGKTYTTSKNKTVDGANVTCYGFNPGPDGLNIPRSAVHDEDEDIAGVEPQ